MIPIDILSFYHNIHYFLHLFHYISLTFINHELPIQMYLMYDQ